jgi:hypothetical protein
MIFADSTYCKSKGKELYEETFSLGNLLPGMHFSLDVCWKDLSMCCGWGDADKNWGDCFFLVQDTSTIADFFTAGDFCFSIGSSEHDLDDACEDECNFKCYNRICGFGCMGQSLYGNRVRSHLGQRCC